MRDTVKWFETIGLGCCPSPSMRYPIENATLNALDWSKVEKTSDREEVLVESQPELHTQE